MKERKKMFQAKALSTRYEHICNGVLTDIQNIANYGVVQNNKNGPVHQS
jgi:hypothetical protein